MVYPIENADAAGMELIMISDSINQNGFSFQLLAALYVLYCIQQIAMVSTSAKQSLLNSSSIIIPFIPNISSTRYQYHYQYQQSSTPLSTSESAPSTTFPFSLHRQATSNVCLTRSSLLKLGNVGYSTILTPRSSNPNELQQGKTNRSE